MLTDKASGNPISNTRYRIKNANGDYEYGVTDDAGHTHVMGTVAAEELIVAIES